MRDAQKSQYIQALKDGDETAVSELLEAGCPVEFRIGSKKRWWPPLIEAIDRGHAGIVSLLLERGADASSLTHFATHLGERVSPLILACQAYIASFKKDKPNALVVVDSLIEHGADVNLHQKGGILDGDTALIIAVRDSGSIELVEKLLDAGADVHASSYISSVEAEAKKRRDGDSIRELILSRI